ncbi:MAG: FUSC family protein [Methylocystis sp.]
MPEQKKGRRAGGGSSMRRLIARYKMELFLCLRVTLAALLTFGVGRILGVPVILWAVLTSVLLTQMSVGKSVKATVDYFAGTLGGAIYAGAISALIPQTTDAGLLAALAAAVAPLALLSAVWPRYAAAPSTGLIVVVAPTLTHATPLVSAIDRVEEVALGAVVALAVSLVVLPARARDMARLSAAAMLEAIADAAPTVFDGLLQPSDREAVANLHRSIAMAYRRFEAAGSEAGHERISLLTYDPSNEPEFERLRVALQRLRHDLIMTARAAAEPLPEAIATRLKTSLAPLEQVIEGRLGTCAALLRAQSAAPENTDWEEAFDAFGKEIVALRAEGLFRPMPEDAVQNIFALAFALEQWRTDLRELEAGVDDHRRD